MIKIIEHGYFKTRLETCGNCGCKFSYDDRDITMVQSAYGNITKVRCPECNCWVTNWNVLKGEGI